MKYKVTLNGRTYEVEVEAGKAMLLDEYEAIAPAPVAAPVAAPAPAEKPAPAPEKKAEKAPEKKPEKKAEPAKKAEDKKPAEKKEQKPQSQKPAQQGKADKLPPMPKKQQKPEVKDGGNKPMQSRTKGEMRTIDTRADNVDLEKYNERYENIAPENKTKQHEGAVKKQKLKQKSQQYRKQGGMRSSRRETEQERLKRIAAERAKKPQMLLKLPEEITVGELAAMLKMTAAEVIKKLFTLGQMATVNEVLDYETAAILAEELGAKVEKQVVVNENAPEEAKPKEKEKPAPVEEEKEVVDMLDAKTFRNIVELRKALEEKGKNKTEKLNSMLEKLGSLSDSSGDFSKQIEEKSKKLNAIFNDTDFDTTGAGESVKNLYGRYQDIQDVFPADITDDMLLHFCES